MTSSGVASPTEQAKANVRFVREALAGGVATKADIDRLDMRMDAMEPGLRSKVGSLRTEMRAEIKALRFQLLAALARATGLLGALRLS